MDVKVYPGPPAWTWEDTGLHNQLSLQINTHFKSIKSVGNFIFLYQKYTWVLNDPAFSNPCLNHYFQQLSISL